MQQRELQLRQWLAEVIGNTDFMLEPASEDASFRSYYRLKSNQNTYIVMDAPPSQEDCEPFVKVQHLLSNNDVNVPQIHAFDKTLGFMLLSDFGNVLFLDVLNEDSYNHLYSIAIDELLKIQNIVCSEDVPPYNQQLLSNELALFSDWFIGKHLGLELNKSQQQVMHNVHELLIANALAQPKVIVHRDFHSRNIMLLDEKPGIIDFQDAVLGPLTYDLASLLKDCYISWPEETIHLLVKQYISKYNTINQTELDFDEFIKWFDLMAAQRHMKAIGIFCRLNYRDSKRKFLYDIPRTLNYLIETCNKYPELSDFAQLLSEIQPKIKNL